MLQVSWVAAEAQLCLWRTPPSVRARLKSWSGPAALGTESLSARWLFLLWTHTCHTRPAAASQGALWDSPALQPYGTYCSWSTDAQMPAKTNNIFYLCFLINSFIFSTFCLFFFFPPSPQACTASGSSPPPLWASAQPFPLQVSQWESSVWSWCCSCWAREPQQCSLTDSGGSLHKGSPVDPSQVCCWEKSKRTNGHQTKTFR